MKNKILALLITTIILSCAPHKKINRLAAEIPCNKVFHFTFDKSSDSVKIVKNGWHLGDSKIPDYKKTFRRSIEDLAKNSQMKLTFMDAPVTPSDSIVQVNVRIESIEWNFYFSSSIMETKIDYELPDRKLKIEGNNKVYLYGTKKGNLYKSLKHGNYLFLSGYCGNRF